MLLRCALPLVAAVLIGCGGGGDSSPAATPSTPSAPAPAPAPAPSVSLAVAPNSIQQAASANLAWSSSNATACVASGGWSGAKGTSGNEATGALASTTEYTLTCSGTGGTAGQTVTATVTQPPTVPPVPTVTLAASPASVASGSAATLTWTSTNAASCTASGNWSGAREPSGSASTGPLTANSAFALTCTGAGGSATQSVNVTVTQASPPSVTLSANPTTVVSGGSTLLSWSSTNATACTAGGGWSGTKATSGSETRSALTATTSYSLTCTGAGGSATQSTTVTVGSGSTPPTVTLSAAPTTVTSGGASTLTWSSSNATSCTASGGWTGAKATSGSESRSGLTATGSYTLTCTGSGGTAAQSVTVTVTAAPVPTVSFSASPSSVASGGTSTLNWSATNATACTASGGWSGTKTPSGSESRSGLAATTTFTLTCSGAGGTASQSVTVNVTQPAPTLALTANPAALQQGGSSTLTWTTSNATACTASGDWTGSRSTSGSESTGALNAARTWSYTLACTGPGGTDTRTASVAVSAAPPVPTVSLSANPAQVASGGTSTLSWSSSNASSCTASGGWTGTKAQSGSQVTSALTQSTTFALACTGPGGTSNASTTVSVTTPPAAAAFPLRVATGQRHLVDQNGRPFLMVGDTPWSLMTGVTRAEAETYLEDRRQRGFNAIIVNIVEHYYNGPVNKEGNAPFQKTGNVYDFSRPVEAYFAHVDYVLGLARDKGFLVLLTPAYLGYAGGQEGWWPEINTAVNTTTVMNNYGRWLGSRYRGFNNIVWVMGGDWYGQESLAKTQALVSGLQATDQAGRLYTAHNARQESGYVYYGSESWFTVNSTYSDCSATPQRSFDDYGRSRVMPFFYFEGRYENESSTTQQCLRSQAYWPVLMGGVGSFFGNRPIWLFDPGWQSALGSQGTQGMVYFARLFRSRPWDRLVPDRTAQVLTSGSGAFGADYAAAARASDGSTVIVYAPSQRALMINMAQISGPTARAWWFNPATGAATQIGDFGTTGTRGFTPPSSGDWVLVIDDASLGLGAPGQ